MNQFSVPLFSCLLLAGSLTGCSDDLPDCEKSPCEPETALQTLEIAEGFNIELFASEPLFRDPVAMEVDGQGRIYVVEDPGYPEEVGGSGAIRLLEDTSGDGYPDSSTIFADSLRAPRGVMAWKEGIIVTDAPDILYFEDTSGDGRADVRRTVMTGFGYGNPQLGVNTPLYGLDNWIYVSHRQGSSRPVFMDQRDDDQAAGRGNIRFRPDSREWESMASSSQFGHSFDAYGRHLHVLHNNHISQEVMDARYLERNPDLLVAPASASISDHGTGSEVFPITENVRHELFTDEGEFTAACGITCYLGGEFPSEFKGAVFVAEPAHNLVHIDRIEEGGTTLVASRMYEDREFLASRDRWFRPVNFYVGPDGALYVIDYYREIIEQPRFLSEEVLASGMLYDGSDRGRIYRISPEGGSDPAWLNRLDLNSASTDELASYTGHENIWWRRTAQRLLTDRQDISAAEPLAELADTGSLPEARIHALWTLEGIGALSIPQIEAALQDPSPRVREQAIRLAETYLESEPGLAGVLQEMSGDSDTRVIFQLLNTLGYLDSEEVVELRSRLLYENIEDEWIQLAALTAGDLDYHYLYNEALSRLAGEETEGRSAYFQRLGMLIGARQSPRDVELMVNMITGRNDISAVWWQAASLDGLADGLRRGGDPGETLQLVQGPMAELALHPESSSLRRSSQQVMNVVGPPSGSSGSQIFSRAEEIAADRNEDPELRVDAIRLLTLSESDTVTDLLAELVQPREPGSVQAAAARATGRYSGGDIGVLLMSRWDGMTPLVREAAMEAMLSDDERIRLVLDAVEEGDIQRSAVSLQQTRRLMLNSDDDLRLRAQSLLGLPDEPRSEVVDRYREAVAMEGEADQGRVVYDRACAMCHQIDGEGGIPYGPDLASVRNRDPEDLLVNILMPNADITAGYEQWRIERQDGSFVQGVIASETPGTVSLRDPSGSETTVPRTEIERMEGINESAMPTGLEHQISIEEMADLLEYMKTR